MASIWASFPWAYGVERIALTPVAAWVAIYPMIVPTSRPRVVLGSILAASADPIMLAVALSHRGDPWPEPGELFGQLYGNGAAVLIAVVGSNTIYRLGRELKAARELGAYRLEERLGGGGMGEVWRASHRFLARPAAVKLIAPPAETEGEDEQLLLRFEREAQATALLQSPHTVELYDFGRAQDGRFYYVMELLEGMDLQKLVAEHGPQPPARVAFLLRQILHSLAEAHADGFVHRDVKPANVFVCRYGLDLDFVKVLDFGLVRSTPEAEDAPAALARSLAEGDVLRGTPAFMAPEQILGDALDGRADLYAVGGVAYWLLTGELVFEGETPMAIVMQHLKEEPDPPSARLGRPVPEELEDLVMALLAKTPEERPPSADAVCAVLEELADSWTGQARRAWWEEVAPRPASSPPAAPPGG
ncbi:MAG TPA: serine/threonine-protein kinase [Polyangiaceae bacterium LLY-WYZ-15_(1-7)]|nr:serine/threonine protein kinase [Myxococcales bacterium]MAT28136.1 serine/threonine protein kinase [Sandaracinus sp.]HJL01003.1 serine/threonine-protein kinase [Polyangiaceae bacterium LLY-WYZ-15_(1-7)]MBJ73716.1 serine/threonine protein kinase [Sandaracinus sp.]HJL12155.1 serine/threonine-protein kinase [Polyangiaceae bacterium LLY-WYZ-15_(1-7)]